MPYDSFNPEVRLGCLIKAPYDKCLVPPNKAGTYTSPKNGREMLAPDRRHLVFGAAAERERSVVAYDELPHIGEARLGRLRLLCPFDFLLVQDGRARLIAFDIPGLRHHEMCVLLGLVAPTLKLPVVHVTDGELLAYVRTGRFPACPFARLQRKAA